MSAQARLRILRAAVLTDPAPWATERVRALYRQHAYAAPQRSTARRDLERLAREGLLVQLGPENNRHYRRKIHA